MRQFLQGVGFVACLFIMITCAIVPFFFQKATGTIRLDPESGTEINLTIPPLTPSEKELMQKLLTGVCLLVIAFALSVGGSVVIGRLLNKKDPDDEVTLIATAIPIDNNPPDAHPFSDN